MFEKGKVQHIVMTSIGVPALCRSTLSFAFISLPIERRNLISSTLRFPVRTFGRLLSSCPQVISTEGSEG